MTGEDSGARRNLQYGARLQLCDTRRKIRCVWLEEKRAQIAIVGLGNVASEANVGRRDGFGGLSHGLLLCFVRRGTPGVTVVYCDVNRGPDHQQSADQPEGPKHVLQDHHAEYGTDDRLEIEKDACL